MIGIIDYRAGNLTSVERALAHLGIACTVTDRPEVLSRCGRIIFPGVGAAGKAMAELRRTGLDVFIKDWYLAGKPILGICLGAQIVLKESEENDATCLGLVPGRVRRFPAGMRDADGQPLKIPHMGWNTVSFLRDHPVFRGLPEGAEFYFVHSYYPSPSDPSWEIGRSEYGVPFCSALARGNLAAVQFHPEKSGRPGLEILRNFSTWRGGDAE